MVDPRVFGEKLLATSTRPQLFLYDFGNHTLNKTLVPGASE